jgi:hypothetical protein
LIQTYAHTLTFIFVFFFINNKCTLNNQQTTALGILNDKQSK